MTKTWFFTLDRGFEPSETFGPARSAAEEMRVIVRAMRENPDLADPEGLTCLYGIAVGDDGIPRITTYSGNFMNRCRARANGVDR